MRPFMGFCFRWQSLDNTWSTRCKELKLAVSKLSLLSAQDALLLLQVTFSVPGSESLAVLALSGKPST